jgi:hypothetical protein
VSRFSVGDSVRYHPVIGRAHDGRVYEVREVGALPQLDHLKRSGRAGRTVYWLEGKAGCVCERSLSLVEGE